jgi:tRNA A-37 threonylcarbamoyl transferase component Bud32
MGFLSSPLGLAVIIPLFIVLSGGVPVTVGQVLMRRSLATQAEQTAAAYAHAVVRSTEAIFGQAGPVLAGLQSLARVAPADRAALTRALATLIAGRGGVSSIGWALDDGTYDGIRAEPGGAVYVHEDVDVDGQMRRTDYRLGESGEPADAMPGAITPFDPRQRPWYQRALRTRGRIWIDHLQMTRSGLPAVLCAEPLAAAGGRAAGVALVVFDLTALSLTLDPLSDDPLVDNVLLTPDRVILAMPHDWVATPVPAATAQVPPAHAAAASTDVAAFLAALPDLSRIGAAGARFAFRSDGQEQLCSILPCPVRGGPTLLLAQVIAQNMLVGQTSAALSTSLVLAALAMGGGVFAAWWFAARLARARREAERQHARADAAEADVERLGSYRLVRKLGQGGMGEVWLGEHRFLACRAAIKRIPPEVFRDLAPAERARLGRRFIDEARITAALRSRHTVELYDYGTARDGSFYYVMELLDGIDFGTLISCFGPQPVGRVIKLLTQACSSLAEAHGCGLVHRDIKPENLYLCRRADEVDLVKVIDFGLVQLPGGQNRAEPGPGLVVGTPSTISPEQARGEELDGRSDIYSLGCVAYSLLTGRDVFSLAKGQDMLLAHVQAVPDPPSCHRRGIPQDLDSIVMLCLAKDRNARPQSAQQLAGLLACVFVPASEEWSDEQGRAWWARYLPPVDAGILAPAGDDRDRRISVLDAAPAEGRG